MTARPLFAYGTLQDGDILAAVLGRTLPDQALRAATLPGFASVYYPGRFYPALVARPGARADGLLILDVSAADWAALDAFEGDEYRRDSLDVQTAHGPIRADVYLPAHPVPDDAAPWSLYHWRHHHKPAVLEQEIALADAARRSRDSSARTPGNHDCVHVDPSGPAGIKL